MSNLYKINNEYNNIYIPIGSVMAYSGIFDGKMNGWILCDGSEYLQTEYPLLFAAISNNYGVPTLGANYFKVPNLKNNFIRGATDNNNLKTNNTYTGVTNLSLTAQHLPIHKHTGTTDNTGAHTHRLKHSDGMKVQRGTFAYSDYLSVYRGNAQDKTWNDAIATEGKHTHTFTLTSFGVNTVTSIRIKPPCVSINYIIKY
jgi:microcystin-dependent protein